MAEKYDLVCPKCDSAHIEHRVSKQWDVENRAWEVIEDGIFCTECEQELEEDPKKVPVGD